MDISQFRALDTCDLDCPQVDVRDGDKSGLEFVPQGSEVVVSLLRFVEFPDQPLAGVLRLAYLRCMSV